jgi:hypothetical protein
LTHTQTTSTIGIGEHLLWPRHIRVLLYLHERVLITFVINSLVVSNKDVRQCLCNKSYCLFSPTTNDKTANDIIITAHVKAMFAFSILSSCLPMFPFVFEAEKNLPPGNVVGAKSPRHQLAARSAWNYKVVNFKEWKTSSIFPSQSLSCYFTDRNISFEKQRPFIPLLQTAPPSWEYCLTFVVMNTLFYRLSKVFSRPFYGALHSRFRRSDRALPLPPSPTCGKSNFPTVLIRTVGNQLTYCHRAMYRM